MTHPTNTLRQALSTDYRITDLRDHPLMAQETPAYTATLTRAGARVAAVRSDGGGGQAQLTWTSDHERDAFYDAARAHCDVQGEWVWEVLLSDLYSVAALGHDLLTQAAGAVLVQLHDDGDWLDGGRVRTARLSGRSQAQIRASLRTECPGARVFDPDACDFVQV